MMKAHQNCLRRSLFALTEILLVDLAMCLLRCCQLSVQGFYLFIHKYCMWTFIGWIVRTFGADIWWICDRKPLKLMTKLLSNQTLLSTVLSSSVVIQSNLNLNAWVHTDHSVLVNKGVSFNSF